MAAGWLTLLGELTALAAGVALSPFSVIPALALVMHSSRPRAVGLAFVAGWLAGKAAITIAFVQVPRLVDAVDAPTPPWTGWVRIVIGLVCLAASVWYWRKPPSTTQTPRWLARIKHISPAVAGLVGVALTVINFKVVVLCAAAGYVIGSRELGVAATGLTVAYFTLVAGSSAAIPILAYSVWAERINRFLETLRRWMERRQRLLTVSVLVLIGLALIASGVSGV